nr:hypothetical protein [Gammaproteobacteria bacterium]
QILLGDPARRKDIINAIWSMNNLVMLMHHLSAEKIKILFANMADQIYKSFLKEDNDQYQKYHTQMLALLTSLPDEKAKIILDTYHLRMMQAIESFDDFKSMNSLCPTHFVYFSRNLRKEQMEAWELDFLALKYYRHYQGETRENFFTAIKEKIVDDIIRNPYRMTSIKDLLDERHWLQCTSLILKDPRCIIKTKYDFNRLYEKLNATQRQELIQRSGELFAEFLTDIHDYCDLYNTLDIDDRDLFFEVSGGIRQAYSLSYRDFSDTYSKLNDSHKEIFFTEREQSGFKEIDDEHFIDTYNGLSNEHKLRFFDKRHDAILDGELDTFEFKRVYTTLLAQHQKMYVDHVMIKLVDQIGKTDTTELKAMVERVYKATQGEHKSLIFEKVFIPFLEHLISLSNVHLQLDSCIRICKSLEPQHQDKFFDGFKHMLPSIIDSYNFAEYHKKLEARHRPFLTAEYANQYARTLATSSDFFNRSYDALDNDEERRILVDKMLAAPVGDKEKFYLESEYTWNILYAKLNEDGKTQLLESTLTHRVQKVYGRVQYERMLDRLQAADKPRFIDAVQKDILNMKRIYDALIESTRSLRASFPASHLFAEDIEPAKFIDRFFKYLESKPESLLAKAWKLYSNNVKYLAREVGEPNPELQEKLEATAEKNSWFASSAGFWGNKALQPDKEGAETSRHSRMLDRLNNPSRK